MNDSPSKPSQPRSATKASSAADARAKATRLITRLETEIAATADQRAVMSKAFDHPVVVEPHRDHHAYHLGADLHFCGLATGDGLAMMGLMSMGPAHVAALLAVAAKDHPAIYVARLWPRLIDANREEYEARGRFVRWQRRWAMYKEEADSWRGYFLESPDGSWRELHMTSSQRYLVQDCAVLARIDIPEGMTRGAAHDWLQKNGANAVYRKGA